jgi:hypothetical protein
LRPAADCRKVGGILRVRSEITPQASIKRRAQANFEHQAQADFKQAKKRVAPECGNMVNGLVLSR